VRPTWKLGLIGVVLAGCIFAAIRLIAPSGVYAGTWKVVLLQPEWETTLCLVRIGGRENAPTVHVIAHNFATAEAEDARVDAGALRFRIKTERGNHDVIVHAPEPSKEVKPPRRLIGSLRDQATYEMVRLEETDQRELDPKKSRTRPPGFMELGQAADAKTPKEVVERLQALLKKRADEPVAQSALLVLLQLQAAGGVPDEVLKVTAERYMAGAAPYGREIELQAATRLTRGLAQLPGGRGAALAVEYGHRAQKLLTGDDPPALSVVVLKALASALRLSGKPGEAREIDQRVAELSKHLDEDFAKSAVWFRPAAPGGRKSASDRVVLVELFTGARCPPCVGADIAFDAALEAYQPSQAVFLQYHEHVPGTDPLTCQAGEARMAYYGKELTGTPTFALDGKILNEPVGGSIQRGEESYSLLRTALDRALEPQPEARLKLAARRTGDSVELTAEVTGLQRPGSQTRLRFALTEEVVRYPAPNGQRLHHHVVRDFPGGAGGFPLPEKTARKTVVADIGKIRSQLQDYLTFVAIRQPFPDDDLPLELRGLKAVAFIQDDVTKQVLQATQVDVPEK
jgi:hypothetical protein